MIRVTALTACAVMLAACSQTSGSGTMMVVRGYAFAPPAFETFCAREALLCSTRGSDEVVELTKARKSELTKVNASVNRRIGERSDLQTAGRADDWRVPTRNGDCEDFAILKKSELMELGWPASALLLTVAWSGGEGHTVLTVRTSDGDLVLDNRTSAIRDWSKTPYRYFARQSQFDGRSWERIGDAQPL